MDGRSDQPISQADTEFMGLLAMRVNAEIERERLIEQRVAETQAAADRLAELNVQLLQAVEARTRLIDMVVHDLSQPISALRTTLFLLRGEEDPAEREECLELIRGRVEAIAALADELLEYGAVRSGRLPWRPERLRLGPFLEACTAEVRTEAPQRGVELELELDERLGTTWSDPAHLRHIVRNLFSNAVKFSARPPESGELGRVIVRAGPAGAGEWRLEVRDNGIGMAPEVAARIFDDFYQEPEARVHAVQAGGERGRGLGLAIVRHLCEAMGARIEVESEPGRGSCFRVAFPIRPGR